MPKPTIELVHCKYSSQKNTISGKVVLNERPTNYSITNLNIELNGRFLIWIQDSHKELYHHQDTQVYSQVENLGKITNNNSYIEIPFFMKLEQENLQPSLSKLAAYRTGVIGEGSGDLFMKYTLRVKCALDFDSSNAQKAPNGWLRRATTSKAKTRKVLEASVPIQIVQKSSLDFLQPGRKSLIAQSNLYRVSVEPTVAFSGLPINVDLRLFSPENDTITRVKVELRQECTLSLDNASEESVHGSCVLAKWKSSSRDFSETSVTLLVPSESDAVPVGSWSDVEFEYFVVVNIHYSKSYCKELVFPIELTAFE